MTLYRWDSIERKFTSTSDNTEMPQGDSAQRRVNKGERTRAEVATGDLLIQVLEGAWRMQIANNELTVHHDEAVVIPSGFSHSAEAIEDSSAVQTVDDPDYTGDDSRWAV